MRLHFARGVDLGGSALIAGGVVLVSAAVAAVVMYVGSTAPAPPADAPTTTAPIAAPGRAAEAWPSDRVATVRLVDAAAGAGAATRAGDRVDVLGYFSRKTTGDEAVTRLLLQDVPVLAAARTAGGVALTLAVAHRSALLLQEVQAMGGRPLVTLRAAQSTPDTPATALHFSDADLADRLAGTG
jgi:Flp pilus assembly protein CpaB